MPALVVGREPRGDDGGERQFSLYAELKIVMGVIPLQTAYGLKGSTGREAEHLAAVEDVTVFVGHGQRCSEVAGGIGALGLHLYGMGLALGEVHLHIERYEGRSAVT